VVIAAIDKTTSTGTTEPAAKITPEGAMGEVEVPTTVSEGRSWRVVSILVGIAIVAAGLAIYKKKATL
jgi:hypothetical protein